LSCVVGIFIRILRERSMLLGSNAPKLDLSATVRRRAR
jgi:hypothetical protein